MVHHCPARQAVEAEQQDDGRILLVVLAAQDKAARLALTGSGSVPMAAYATGAYASP